MIRFNPAGPMVEHSEGDYVRAKDAQDEIEEWRADAERYRTLERLIELQRIYVVPATGNAHQSVEQTRNAIDAED